MTSVSSSLQAPPELVGPDYTVYRFRDDFYKVVRFASTAPRVAPVIRHKGEKFAHDEKLVASISRASRVCLELAVCNEWKWFCTFTIAKDNYDRKNLECYYKAFKEWLKYQAEKLGVSLPYLLVPEQHGDGSWHMHGFFTAAIDPLLVSFRSEYDQGMELPYKLIEKDYYDCPVYRKRFGFCSFGLIRDPIACAFYTTKYITKSFLGDAKRVGLNLYYCSHGLNRSSKLADIFGPSSDLDSFLQRHYEFCSTGFIMMPSEVGDDPMLDLVECLDSRLSGSLPVIAEPVVIPESCICADEYHQIMMDLYPV